MAANSAQPSKLLKSLISVTVALAAAIGGYIWLARMDHSSNLPAPLRTGAIAQVESLTGQAEFRPPETLAFKPLEVGEQLESRTVLITQKTSEAVLAFRSDTRLAVPESTRIVIEADTRNDAKNDDRAVVVTILEGDAVVLDAGLPGKFRLIRNGKELALSGTTKMVPMIQQGPQTTPGAGQSIQAPSSGTRATPALIISATVAEDPIRASGAPEDNRGQSGMGDESLTNEDIVRQLKSQTGFFQRCYLTYIHRTRPSSANKETSTQEDGSLSSGGTVTVAFTIQSNGRASQTKIVRSDFQDTVLHKCVLDVIERTPFRSFQGEAVPVIEFPIRLL